MCSHMVGCGGLHGGCADAHCHVSMYMPYITDRCAATCSTCNSVRAFPTLPPSPHPLIPFPSTLTPLPSLSLSSLVPGDKNDLVAKSGSGWAGRGAAGKARKLGPRSMAAASGGAEYQYMEYSTAGGTQAQLSGPKGQVAKREAAAKTAKMRAKLAQKDRSLPPLV